MFAIVDIRGRVKDIVASAPTLPAGITLRVVSCDNTVRVGWSYNGFTFSASPQPAPDQQAATVIAAGIQITSTGTPALNGTYGIDADARANISGIVAGLAIGAGFPPADAATLDYGDIAGQVHTFTQDQFKNFAKAVRDYMYAIDVTLRTLAQGGNAAWPSAQVTIA